MNDLPEAGSITEQPAVMTQAQLYDDLRRIGQLEDQKQVIQLEINQKTERLRSALPQLEKDSLLYQMLSAALPATSQSPNKRKVRTNRKKTTKRKR